MSRSRVTRLDSAIIGGLWILTVLLTLGCASKELRSSPNRMDTAYTKRIEIVYTPANWPAALKADLYQPKGSGPWPTVLLIYGGSWSSADHRWQMRLLARKLARRGFVVMNASYRGLPEFRYPAPVEDLREALRWLRAHASEYHLDPKKIATYGFSAGGHLAAQIGALDGPPEVRVQAVVAASAPTDFTLFPDDPTLARFVGASYANNPALFREASPVFHVTPDDPPVFIYHGTADKTVSPQHAKTFQAALERNSVRHELHWAPGRGHAGMLIFGGELENAAIDFLDEVLRGTNRGK